jgi:hypothetical protein
MQSVIERQYFDFEVFFFAMSHGRMINAAFRRAKNRDTQSIYLGTIIFYLFKFGHEGGSNLFVVAVV